MKNVKLIFDYMYVNCFKIGEISILMQVWYQFSNLTLMSYYFYKYPTFVTK